VDFGLFFYCQGRGVPDDQAYAEILDQIALAEQLGFQECWFAEHHFTDYSVLPSPNLMIAAAVQRTQRMRFGNYINILPFHNPARLAAEAAMLDNLARGRFDFGVGKGVRPGGLPNSASTLTTASPAGPTPSSASAHKAGRWRCIAPPQLP
jgi:alkanesulfonate monooxygenase SsuD/methylene tetrahydromethanopterin reductase-like flavin-dependent oxidoreductase (luciferase family)